MLIFNLMLWLVYAIWHRYMSYRYFFGGDYHFLVFFNLTYLISIMRWNIILHRSSIRFSQVFDKVIKTVLTQEGILFFVLWLTGDIVYFPLRVMAAFIVFTFLACCVWRFAMWKLVRFQRKHSKLSTLIILGSGEVAKEVQERFCNNVNNKIQLVGYFDDEEQDKQSLDASLRLGNLDDVIRFLKENTVESIVCTLPSGEDRKALPIMNYAENHLIRFYLVPDFKRFLPKKVSLEFYDNIPLVSLREEPLERWGNKMIKRLFDICFSGLFLATIFPFIFIVVAIAIKAESKGPVFFKQKRTGYRGREFYCLKFRSMTSGNKEADEKQATKNDARITKVGHFLRKTSIDEMPQFINVFLGDMSVVGPRPHMIRQTEDYVQLVDKYMLRHLQKPGVTGLAQVSGFRGEITKREDLEGRIQKDIFYIENWNFFFDIRIILKTVYLGIVGDKKAY